MDKIIGQAIGNTDENDSHRNYRNLVENAVEFIYTVNLEGFFTYANPATLRATGYSIEEARRLTYLDLVVPSYRESVKRFYLRQFLAKEMTSHLQFPFHSKSGREMWFDQNCSLIFEGETIIGFHMVSRDVTEQILAKEELAKSISLLRATLDSTADGILVVTTDGKIETYNRKFLDIWHIPQSIIETRDDTAALSFIVSQLEDPEGFIRKVNELYSNPAEESFDAFKLKDGRVFERYSQPQFLGKNIRGRVWSFRDVTEKKRAQEHLQASHLQLRALAARVQSVKEQESERIAREIHDELGQALTGLKMDIRWLQKHATGDPEKNKERTQSMLELVDSTIVAVRRIATELRPHVLDSLGLIPAIEWQIQEFQTRTGITCSSTDIDSTLQFTPEQSTAFFRILQEALTNIIRHAQASEVTISLQKKGDQIVLSVSDNGHGATEEQVNSPHAFGVMGMRERIVLLGGKLSISGTKGGGTTVTVMLPTH